MSHKIVLLFAVCAVLPVAAWGAKQCQTGEADFPSVNADGSVNVNDEIGTGTGSICINTSNGKFVVKASGQTTNHSGKGQTYKDDPTVNDFYGFPGRGKYHVAKSGKAKFLFKGQAPLP